jgi:hypothetical protein
VQARERQRILRLIDDIETYLWSALTGGTGPRKPRAELAPVERGGEVCGTCRQRIGYYPCPHCDDVGPIHPAGFTL